MTNKDNTENKDFYTDFFENAPEAMALLDADGIVLAANLAHRQLFRSGAETLTSQFYGDFFQAPQPFLDILNRLKAGTTCTSPILRVKGESHLDVQLRANGAYNEQGNLISVRIAVQDVTTQKQAELLRAIQHETTMLLVGSASILEALSQVTERLRLWLEYDVAIVWKEQGKDNRLARVVLNTEDDRDKHDYLLARSISVPLAIGTGYPATAWFSGKTERLTLTNQTVIFAEQGSRISREYKDIVTFPINIGRHTWGLVSFFSQKKRVLDASVLEALASIGLQIGQFVDRIEAIEAYSRSQERYYVAISGSNDGIWDWDLLSNEVFYSPRYKEQLGFEDHELGNNFEVFRDLCHPDDYPRVMDEVQRHIEEKVPYDVEFRMRTKSGDYKWISAKGQAVWNAQGKPVRFAGSHRDIDELKAAEAARLEYERKLLDSEQMFRQLADNIRDTFWILDLSDGSFIYVSPACETIFEKSSQDLYLDP
jgi:PAS domain S-box